MELHHQAKSGKIAITFEPIVQFFNSLEFRIFRVIGTVCFMPFCTSLKVASKAAKGLHELMHRSRRLDVASEVAPRTNILLQEPIFDIRAFCVTLESQN